MVDKKSINGWAVDKGYKVISKGKNPNIVLVGERHYVDEQISNQAELVGLLNPGYVLHEFAHGFIFNADGKQKQNDRLFEESDYFKELPTPVAEWVSTYKIIIVGSDLTGAEVDIASQYNPNPFGFKTKSEEIDGNYDTRLEYLIDSKGKPLSIQQIEKLHTFHRENRMGDDIIKWSKRTNEPLIAIYGDAHLRPSSCIHKKLKADGLDYLTLRLKKN